MASFADIQYCIYADKVGGWGPKRPKICSRNIGMVPSVTSDVDLEGAELVRFRFSPPI